MKGLLAKDFLLTIKMQGKVLCALTVFAVFMTLTSEDPFFIVSYLTFICTIFSMSSITFDEYGNGFSFLFTLPVDVKTYVFSKYIFSSVISLIAATVSFLFVVLTCVVQGRTDSIIDYIIPTLCVVMLVFLYQAILIPIQLKFGAEKSRMVIFGVTGAMVVICMGIFKILKTQEILLSKVMNFISHTSVLQLACMMGIICMLCMIGSYQISKRIMNNKEF